MGLAALVVGCSGSAANDGPYAEDFEGARSHATTAFERDVLDDGAISRAEYEEAFQRFGVCLQAAGQDATFETQAGFMTFSIAGRGRTAQDVDAVVSQCQKGTTELIEPLYISVVRNPQNEYYWDVVVRCLQRKGLVDAAFTAEDYLHYFRDQAGSVPFDPEGTDAQLCASNPSQ